jgi:outer membrane protein OmpA-like peptidoglycan-associated protein
MARSFLDRDQRDQTAEVVAPPPAPEVVAPEPVVVPEPEPAPVVVSEPEPAPEVVPEPEPEPEPALAVLDADKREIVILDHVYFDLDRDVIRAESYPVLDAVVAVLLDTPELERLEVQGHTDSRGSAAYNRDLSERRAASVRRYLEQHGVDPARLQSHGYGEDAPLLPDARSEAAHAQNRRVQFIVLTLAEGGPDVEVAAPGR